MELCARVGQGDVQESGEGSPTLPDQCEMLLQLDEQLLERILAHLPLPALSQVSQTCRRLRHVLWRRLNRPPCSNTEGGCWSPELLKRLYAPGVEEVYFCHSPPNVIVPVTAWRSLIHLHLGRGAVVSALDILRNCPSLSSLRIQVKETAGAEWPSILRLLAKHRKLQSVSLSCQQTYGSAELASVSPMAEASVFAAVTPRNITLRSLTVYNARNGHVLAQTLLHYEQAFPALRELDLDCAAPAPALPMLAAWAAKRSARKETLRALSLQGNAFGGDTAAMHALATLLDSTIGLQQLYVGWCGLGDDSARIMAEALRHNTTLQLLYAPSNQLTSVGIVTLCDALDAKSSALHCLNLAANVSCNADACKSLGRACTQSTLACLTLDSMDLEHSLPSLLAALQQHPDTDMHHLSLCDCNLSSDTCQLLSHLQSTGLASLHNLNMRQSQ